MTRTNRRRAGPLRRFGQRSPLHALVVWLIKSALILLIGFAAWMYVSNIAVPDLANRMVEQIESQ